MAISMNEAQRLLNTLRKHLTLAEDALQTLIEEKAWEPLGYATFREMWQEEIAEFVELNSLIRAVILFEMIDEANEELGHADQLLDTSPDFVQAVKDAHARGLNAGDAATHADLTVVRQHTRKPRGSQTRVTVTGLDGAQIDYYKGMAKKFGVKQSDFWTEGFQIGMDRLIAERLEADAA